MDLEERVRRIWRLLSRSRISEQQYGKIAQLTSLRRNATWTCSCYSFFLLDTSNSSIRASVTAHVAASISEEVLMAVHRFTKSWISRTSVAGRFLLNQIRPSNYRFLLSPQAHSFSFILSLLLRQQRVVDVEKDCRGSGRTIPCELCDRPRPRGLGSLHQKPRVDGTHGGSLRDWSDGWRSRFLRATILGASFLPLPPTIPCRRRRLVWNFVTHLGRCSSTPGAYQVSIRWYGTDYVRGSEHCILAWLWLVTDIPYVIAFEGLLNGGRLLVFLTWDVLQAVKLP